MAMQVSSLSMGGAPAGVVLPAAAPQEFPQEKRLPLPGEPKAAIDQFEAAMPGGRKSQAQDLQKTAADLETISLTFNRRLKFEIDQESREILIKVIDNETDKVIKVLPPEELQRLHSRIRETIGFLFDKLV